MPVYHSILVTVAAPYKWVWHQVKVYSSRQCIWVRVRYGLVRFPRWHKVLWICFLLDEFFWARMFQGWRNSLARRSWRVRFPLGPQNRWNCHRHINLLYKFRRWCIHTDLSAYESVGDKQKWKPHSGLSWIANRFFLLEWRSAETQNSLESNPEELGSIPRYATKIIG